MQIIESTIAAIATPLAAGGIAVIRISGEQAIPLAGKVFSPKHKNLETMEGYTAAFGEFTENGQPFDDGVCLVYHAPHSYTGEDTVELFCHGGIYLAGKILALLYSFGAAPASPGEFTRRAFENGKLDLTAAESVMNLISASGESALKEAYLAKSGKLYEDINTLEQLCMEMAGMIVAYIDYPDEVLEQPEGLKEKLTQCLAEVERLLAGYENGKVYRQGVSTVILGRPNAGKSALMNLLVGGERSIVTPVPGTTRDVVCETVRLGKLLLAVSDTAGIHDSADFVEQIGIAKAKELLRSAELVLAVFDSSETLCRSDYEVMELSSDLPCICVVNKADLDLKIELGILQSTFKRVVTISALDGSGLDRLEAAVEELFCAKSTEEPVIFNTHQKALVLEAKTALTKCQDDLAAGQVLDVVLVGIEAALERFGEVTGKNISAGIIDEVFSKFCVGK